jgi:hypothetical protein
VHDHSQPACQGHDRLFHPAARADFIGIRSDLIGSYPTPSLRYADLVLDN